MHSFLGRETEQARLEALVRAKTPLVTVLGPPGAGKTRLVRHVLPDAVHLPLGRLSLSALEARIAVALGLMDEVSLEQLRRALVADGRVLVLDGAEQGRALVPVLLERLGAPIVITSRVRVAVDGEHLVELGGLARSEAIELLQARVAAVDVPVVDAELAAGIVARLDRLPLTVELVAVRMRLMSPASVLARLVDSDLSSLTGSLAAEVEASWHLLNMTQRRALARLTVFEGGFDVEWAEAVLDDLSGPAIEILATLRDHSMLARSGQGLRLFDVVRAFARRHLDDDERRIATHRQARWAACWGLRLAERAGRGDRGALEQLLAAQDDLILLVKRRGSTPEDHLFSVCSGLHAARRGMPATDHLAMLDYALTSPAPKSAARCRVELHRAEMLRVLGRPADAREQAGRALSDAGERGWMWCRIEALAERGRAERALGDPGAACASFEAAWACKGIAEDLQSARLACSHGLALKSTDRLDEATVLLQRAASFGGPTSWIALVHLADVAQTQGQPGLARIQLQTALTRAVAWGDESASGHILSVLAELASLEGDDERASASLAAARSHLLRAGDNVHLAVASMAEGDVAYATSSARALMLYRRAEAELGEAQIRSIQLHLEFRLSLAQWPPPDATAALARNARAVHVAETTSPRMHGLLIAVRRRLEVAAGAAHTPAPPPSPTTAHAIEILGGERAPHPAPWQSAEERFVSLWLTHQRRDVIQIAVDAVVLPDARVDLKSRPLIARLVHHLWKAHRTQPRQWVPGHALIEAMWPDEILVGHSGRDRLYNAVAEARRLGLRSLITSCRAGYRLAPDRQYTGPVG